MIHPKEEGQDKIVVHVDPEIAELIPKYMKSRLADLKSIQEALKERDFSAINHVAHKVKGSAQAYGFEKLSIICKELEKATEHEKLEEATALIDEYDQYLSHVEVVYDPKEDSNGKENTSC